MRIVRRIGGTGSPVGSASDYDHGVLLGLTDDDHPQYLLVGGSRAMSGNLDMGTNAITNVGNVDGRDVSADGSALDTHIADTTNPHSTDIGNLGAGTLSELNTAVTDATLDDSSDPRDPNAHASSHETGGADEIDGDKLDIDWTPSNYTPTATPTEADNVDNLTSHLYGIDQALAGAGGGGLETVYTDTDTTTDNTPTQLGPTITISDNDLMITMVAWVQGYDATNDEAVHTHMSGIFVRKSGSTTLRGTVAKWKDYQVGDTAVEFVVSGADVYIEVTGVTGQTFDWTLVKLEVSPEEG